MKYKMDYLAGFEWSETYRVMFKISCLSSMVSSGNFFDESLLLKVIICSKWLETSVAKIILMII